MQRVLLAPIVLAALTLAACESSKPAPVVDTQARAVTLPAPPAMVIGEVELPQRIASEISASRNPTLKVEWFWQYAVVSKALRETGLALSEDDLETARRELLASETIVTYKTGEPHAPGGLEELGLVQEYEQNWVLTALAGMKKLGDAFEVLSPGTLTATETEIAEAKRIAFGETADIYDYICAEKLEATQIIADFKKGLAPAEVAKKRTVHLLSVSKLDKRIAEEFQTEIWTTLKATPGAYSTEERFDKRYGNWHVICIKAVNPAREPSNGELRVLKKELAEMKRAKWTREQLKRLKIASLPSVTITDPQLKIAFASRKEFLLNPPSTTPGK
jgi:hypothetical protein